MDKATKEKFLQVSREETLEIINREAQNLNDKDLKHFLAFLDVLQTTTDIPTPAQKNEKTPEEIAEQKKKEELRAKWFKEGKELEKIPMYERNETMKRIANIEMPHSVKLWSDYEEVKKAHRDFIPYRGVYDLAYNCLLLGYMHGMKDAKKGKKKRTECK